MIKRLTIIVLIALLIPTPVYGSTNKDYKHYKHTRTYHAKSGKITIYK